MVLVDDDYRFTYVDIGDYGSNFDVAVFKNCAFGKAFMNNELDVHHPHLSQITLQVDLCHTVLWQMKLFPCVVTS